MTAPTTSAASLEIHHQLPRYLLRLRDRADAGALDAAGIEAWMDYEHEAMRYRVDPDVTREALAEMVDASTVAIAREDHRASHASDFVRWGRMGGPRDAPALRPAVVCGVGP